MSAEPTFEDLLPSVVVRASEGEVFQDDGWRLGPLLLDYLRQLSEKPSERKSLIYSPSQLGGCMRALYWNRIGIRQQAKVSPELRLIFDTGHAIQWQYNNYFREMFGLDEVALNLPAELTVFRLAGEADFVLLHVENGRVRRVLDLKSIKDEGFGRLREPTVLRDGTVTPPDMKKYIWQLHAYMAMLDCELATLFYVNKNTGRFREIPFVFDGRVWERIWERINQVEHAIETGEPPAFEASKFTCPECPFFWHCQPPGVRA